jgi:hypothetical protein
MNTYDALDLMFDPREPAVDVLADVFARHRLLGTVFRAALRCDAFLADRRSGR